MNVLGYEVSEQQERACLDVMGRAFKAEDVKFAALNAGVPETWTAANASRQEDLPRLVANRLINRMLKEGKIRADGGIFVVVERRDD